jgi:hypothetical protein
MSDAKRGITQMGERERKRGRERERKRENKG